MKQVKDIQKFVKDWYKVAGFYSIPQFGTRDFVNFVGSSASLVFEVAPKATKSIITLENDPNVVGYCRTDKESIHLGAKLFVQEYYSELFGSDDLPFEELATMFINGVIAHEAGHVNWTPKGENLWDTIVKNSYSSTLGKAQIIAEKYGKGMVCSYVNIIEDMYIEHHTTGGPKLWIEMLWDVMFDELTIQRMFEMDESERDFNWWTNLLVSYKNAHYRDHEVFKLFPKRVKELLNKLINMTTFHTSFSVRADIALQILTDILDLLPKSEKEIMEQNASESGEGEGDSDTTPQANGKLDEIEKEMDEIEEQIISEILESESKKIAQRDSTHIDYSDGKVDPIHKVVEQDVYIASTTHDQINPTGHINTKFVKDLVAIRTERPYAGQAVQRGGRMRASNLTRIATDSKIFAKTNSSINDNKRLEIVIVLDFSGSATGTIVNNELGVGIQISNAMRKARIAHSVYAQTSIDWDIPLLVHLWSYDMIVSNSDIPRRQKEACKISLENNADGLILEAAAKKFTGRDATRMMLVLSDGQPSSTGYTGSLARQHTANVVKDIRKKGIGVISLSVVSSVVDANNNIYGRNFNIDASSNTMQQMKKIIKKLSLGG